MAKFWHTLKSQIKAPSQNLSSTGFFLRLNPSLRFLVIRKHAYIGVYKDARQPCLPSDPLVAGDDGDLAEIMVVFAAEEFDFFPGHINH